jgi:hypothetical protein
VEKIQEHSKRTLIASSTHKKKLSIPQNCVI